MQVRPWLTAVALALVAAVWAPMPAAAVDDPPNLVGLTVSQAEQALLAWNQSVIIQFVPDLKNLPPAVAPEAVLVASSHLVPVAGVDVQPPQVEVDLGTTLPDLTGLTSPSADQLLNPLRMKLVGLPSDAAPDWVVRLQRPAAGTVVAFDSAVTVLLRPPGPATAPATTPVTTPPVVVAHPRPWTSRPVLVGAVAGGSALLLLIGGVVTASSLRRRRRRRGAPPERIEARGYPGQVVGPHLHAPAPSLSVRLEPHHNPGAIVIHDEVPR